MSLSSLLRRILRPFLGRGLFGKPGLRRLASLFSRLYHPEYVEFEGRTLYLNPNDPIVGKAIMLHGSYEPMETEYVRRSVSPGDTVVDVGAHIGYFTLLLSSLVGPDGKVYALEPDPENFRYLQKTVAALPERNVELHHVAAWKREEMLPWHRSGSNPGDHSLLAGEGRTTTEQVEARRLDSIIPPGTVVDFLKVDVQGAEGGVLDGMARLLDEGQPRRMLLEFMPSQIRAAGYDPGEIFGMLLNRGYAIRMISEYGGIDEPVDAYESIDRLCTEDWRFVNLFCER